MPHFVPCLHCLVTVASFYGLKSGGEFFLGILLATMGLLWIHTNVRMVCSISVKNAIGILVGIALNMYILVGRMDIFTPPILSLREHRISFHLFASSISSLMCPQWELQLS